MKRYIFPSKIRCHVSIACLITFECPLNHYRWLDKREDDGALERELYPSADDGDEYEPFVTYEIVTYTSDIIGACSIFFNAGS